MNKIFLHNIFIQKQFPKNRNSFHINNLNATCCCCYSDVVTEQKKKSFG